MHSIDAAIHPGGLTALECAIEHLDIEAARAALAAGADPNRPGLRGVRPLHWSVDTEMEEALYRYDTARDTSPPKAEMTAFLLAHGADPTLPDDSGSLPVDWARGRGHQPALELFARHGTA